MNRKYLDDLARVVTKAGVLLLENGAEVYRVEETMYKLCESYGCSTIDSYATPSLLIISFTLDGELSHNVKRVKMKSINLDKVDRVNDLSRRVKKDNLSLEELNAGLLEIEGIKPYPHSWTIIGAMVSSAGFCMAFGGDLIDALWAFVIGFFVRIITILLTDTPMDGFFRNILCSFVLTFMSLFLQVKGMCSGTPVISGTIMLLVPGLAITNAIRDSINGDLNSSLIRFLEAIFIAVAMGVGSGLAYLIFKGSL